MHLLSQAGASVVTPELPEGMVPIHDVASAAGKGEQESNTNTPTHVAWSANLDMIAMGSMVGGMGYASCKWAHSARSMMGSQLTGRL